MTNFDFCESNNILFQERELPTKIKGFSYHDNEGRFIVVVNSKLSIIQNRKTAEHELQHIMSGENENKTYIEYE